MKINNKNGKYVYIPKLYSLIPIRTIENKTFLTKIYYN